MNIINLIGLVSAHTGNDLVDHSFEMADAVVGFVFAVVIILGIYFFKKYKKKNKG